MCTENSILIDYVTESPNVSGDDRSVMLLPDPVHLAVQVEEPSEQSSENEQCNNTHHDWIKGDVGLRRRDVQHRRALSIPTTSMSHASTNSLGRTAEWRKRDAPKAGGLANHASWPSAYPRMAATTHVVIGVDPENRMRGVTPTQSASSS